MWPGGVFREQHFGSFLLPCPDNNIPFLGCNVNAGPFYWGRLLVCLPAAYATVTLCCGRWMMTMGEGYHVCTILAAGRHWKGEDASYDIKPGYKRCTVRMFSGVLASRLCQADGRIAKKFLKSKLKLCNSSML